ncbi:hypothetical protein GGF32_006898 [Allomyces javanicus]|nr:hypothetical protein GGF32_006898 [Allomyces javanicus]
MPSSSPPPSPSPPPPPALTIDAHDAAGDPPPPWVRAVRDLACAAVFRPSAKNDLLARDVLATLAPPRDCNDELAKLARLEARVRAFHDELSRRRRFAPLRGSQSSPESDSDIGPVGETRPPPARPPSATRARLRPTAADADGEHTGSSALAPPFGTAAAAPDPPPAGTTSATSRGPGALPPRSRPWPTTAFALDRSRSTADVAQAPCRTPQPHPAAPAPPPPPRSPAPVSAPGTVRPTVTPPPPGSPTPPPPPARRTAITNLSLLQLPYRALVHALTTTARLHLIERDAPPYGLPALYLSARHVVVFGAHAGPAARYAARVTVLDPSDWVDVGELATRVRELAEKEAADAWPDEGGFDVGAGFVPEALYDEPSEEEEDERLMRVMNPWMLQSVVAELGREGAYNEWRYGDVEEVKWKYGLGRDQVEWVVSAPR